MDVRTNLMEASRWLEHLRMSGASVFSSRTKPDVTIFDLLDADFMQSDPDALWAGIERAVEELAQKRRRCLSQCDRELKGDAQGRLLAYVPDLETYAQLNTGSAIVDTFDVPAWDTWIWALGPQGKLDSEDLDRAVISWIPDWYYAAADEAVACSMGTLLWIDADRRAFRIRAWATACGILK